MKENEAKYVRLVLRQRNLFIRKAEPLIFKALNKQMEPIFHLGVLHPIGTEIDHLIHPEPIAEALHAIYRDVARHFGKATHTALIKVKTKADDDDYMDDAIDDFIATKSAEYITGITDATKKAIKDFIAANREEGWGAAQLATELRKNFTDINRMRSMRIARTEVGRASNFAGDAASKMFDFKMTKTWLHAGSSKEDRESHVSASGQTVGNDDTFDVDGSYQPLYPQDGSGGADEEVNCNCMVYRTRIKDNASSEG